MKNINDCIKTGSLEQLADLNYVFTVPQEGCTGFVTKMLQRGTVLPIAEDLMRTGILQAKDITWKTAAEYHEQEKALTYYFHENSPKPGVNILEIPFNNKNAFPCFVASGKLSGCVYAWFLVKNKAIFLHAGADNGNGTTEDKEIRRCRERADILNGLYYSLDKNFDNPEDCLTTEKLLEKVQDVVKTGQIIYPANQAEERDMGKVQTMSYRPLDGKPGECLCIITNTEKGILVSGMMTEKDGVFFENIQGRILKVDTNGVEI